MRPRDKPVPSTSVEGPAVLGPARIFQEQHFVVVVVTTERERDPIDEAAPDSLKFKFAQCTSLMRSISGGHFFRGPDNRSSLYDHAIPVFSVQIVIMSKLYT